MQGRPLDPRQDQEREPDDVLKGEARAVAPRDPGQALAPHLLQDLVLAREDTDDGIARGALDVDGNAHRPALSGGEVCLEDATLAPVLEPRDDWARAVGSEGSDGIWYVLWAEARLSGRRIVVVPRSGSHALSLGRDQRLDSLEVGR